MAFDQFHDAHACPSCAALRQRVDSLTRVLEQAQGLTPEQGRAFVAAFLEDWPTYKAKYRERAEAAEWQARTLRLCLQILLDDSEPAEHWRGPLNEYVLLSLNAIEQARRALAGDAGQEGSKGG